MSYLSPDEFKRKYTDYTTAIVDVKGGYGQTIKVSPFIIKIQDIPKNFVQELNVCCSYNSPYVMKVLHWTYDPSFSRPYIFAQPQGVPLIEALQKGLITLEKAAQDIYLGMRFLHDQGLIHLDIKPENVVCLQDVQTSEWRAVLIDFGLSVYGYNYKNGLFSYKNLAYTPGFKDPEYDSETYNSYDSDYYAYAASIVVLYAILIRKDATTPFFFDANIMIGDDGYQDLKQVCDMCLTPRKDRGNIRAKVESLPFFNFLKTHNFSESQPLPDPKINNLEFNQDIFQPLKSRFEAFLSFPAEMNSPEKSYRARTGFLTWHLLQLFIAKYRENPDNIANLNYLQQNIGLYMNACYILSSYVYSNISYNFSQIMNDQVWEVLAYLRGRVRYLTLWDYSRCGTELYIQLFTTLKPDYLNTFYTQRQIYYIDECQVQGDDKNILYIDVVNKVKSSLVIKQPNESRPVISGFETVNLPDFPLISPVDVNPEYEINEEIRRKIYTNFALLYMKAENKNIYNILAFLCEIISKKRIYDYNPKYKNDISKIFNEYPIFKPLEKYFPEYRLEE